MKPETNATWEQMYRRLCSYKKKYGDCNVPCTRSNDEMAVLGNWVQLLRQKKKGVGGSLSQEQIDRLEKLGFVWNLFDTKWDQQYEELCKFQKKHGHCNVPKDGEHQLGYWVSKQRVQRNSGNMRQDRIDRLEMVGFVWDFKANNWEHMFGQLCEFKKKHGHCLVPASKVKGKDDDEFRSLGLWVQTQRQQKKGTRKSRIPQDRIDRLDEIGFVWEPRDATWNESFQELKKFREENGHCNVPKVTKKLHSWIDKQRNRYRSGKMRSDRKAKLDSVEFFKGSGTKGHQLPAKQSRGKGGTRHQLPSKQTRSKGGTRHQLPTKQTRSKGGTRRQLATKQRRRKGGKGVFDRLVEFNKIHGHWRVPPSYEKDTSLAKWIESQSTRRKIMKPERVKRLNSIGFPWTSIDGDLTGNTGSETHSDEERNDTEVNNDDTESDSFDSSNEAMSAGWSSPSDKKPKAKKSTVYPVGTKVETVRTTKGTNLLRA